MEKIVISSFIVLFFVCRIEAQTWQKIDMTFPQTDTLLRMSYINFATENVGWIFTAETYLNGTQKSIIFKTIDGGRNWAVQYKGDFFLNVSTFSLDSLYCWAVDAWGGIIFTTDGGVNWDTSTIALSTGGEYFGLPIFLNSQEGIVFHWYPWYTNDGGKSWRIGDTTGIIFLQPMDVIFPDDKKGWVVGEGNPLAIDAGFIANTTDGGMTWQYQDHPYMDTASGIITPALVGIDFIDTSTGFAVGNNSTYNSPFIMSTTNGGTEWETKQLIGAGVAWDIGFLDKNNGWFISSAGRIWKTTDGGATWNLQNVDVSARLEKIIILRKEKIGYIFGNNLLFCADLSDIDNIDQNELETPKEFSLFQNYPNPFNPTTTIEFQIPPSPFSGKGERGGFVSLKVYDLLGREIKTLVNEQKSPGIYNTEWNASNFLSGVYFYRLNVHSHGEQIFSQVKKMLLMK